jgi:hypothetical protein
LIQKLGGHKRQSTTEICARVAAARVKVVYDGGFLTPVRDAWIEKRRDMEEMCV